MLTELLFKKTKAGIGVRFPTAAFPLPALVEFDASISETHSDSAETSDHPVEDGSDITDHIRVLPKTIEINGVITNTPIIFLATLQAKSPVTGDLTRTLDRVETGYQQLQDFMNRGILVDVITSLRTYSNMVLLSMAVTRDAASGNILDCTLSLREMKIATAMSIDVPVPIDKANNEEKNAGQKQAKPKETTTSTSTESTTPDSELHAIGGVVGL